MAREVASASAHGIGFTGALALLFIALKLLGYIDWPWLWVLAPIWIPWGMFALFVIVLLMLYWDRL